MSNGTAIQHFDFALLEIELNYMSGENIAPSVSVRKRECFIYAIYISKPNC